MYEFIVEIVKVHEILTIGDHLPEQGQLLFFTEIRHPSAKLIFHPPTLT